MEVLLCRQRGGKRFWGARLHRLFGRAFGFLMCLCMYVATLLLPSTSRKKKKVTRKARSKERVAFRLQKNSSSFRTRHSNLQESPPWYNSLNPRQLLSTHDAKQEEIYAIMLGPPGKSTTRVIENADNALPDFPEPIVSFHPGEVANPVRARAHHIRFELQLLP